jgi:hypothetical protein
MDSVLQAQFERMEKALSTLVDSIASFNPSPQAAFDLVAADDELSSGLDQRMSQQYRIRKSITDRIKCPNTRPITRASLPSAPKLKPSKLNSGHPLARSAVCAMSYSRLPPPRFQKTRARLL